MCGICGIVNADSAAPVSDRQLADMRDVLAHRGPDDAGVYRGPGVALGSRRLSIVDLSPRGHMPMASPDGRYHIVYNGEVYNYRELRSLLEAKGHTFRSNTDTEVVLRLYEVFGASMLERLNGMFAFAIWDAAERTLFAARDRLGVKPLYYAQYKDAFYFASEEKSLFEAGVPVSFDRDVWEELLCFRYVAGERTPFAGVKRLLPGHFLTFRRGQLQVTRWWNLSERACALREDLPPNPTEWFRETFDSAVRLRRISDVPVGVLLSGGLDSGTIAATLGMQAGGGHSFTVRFSEDGYDEGPLAQAVARRSGLEWHELRLTPDAVIERLAGASWLNDEPLAHDSDVHLWAIAQFAKPRVTVLLSGEGADESLGGYVRYRPLRYPRLLKPARAVLPWVAVGGLRRNTRVRKLARFLALNSVRDFVLFNACDALPGELPLVGATPVARFPYRERVVDEAIALYPNEPMRQAMYTDQHTFLCSLLDRNDRMTMGASIECRVPFLDYRLVEVLAALPTSVLCGGRESKPLLRNALGSRLPDDVLRARKWGFGVPWRRYLRETPRLRELVRELPEHQLIREGPIEPSAVREMVNRFLEGDDAYAVLVKQLVVVTTWHGASCRPRVNRSRPSAVPGWTARVAT